MQHLQPNTILQGGKYRIESVLGQGGFGITYLAEQIPLKRKVAIKEFFMGGFCSRGNDSRTLSADHAQNSQFVEQYKQKFLKEATTLAKLNHPNIINIFEVFEENDTVYYSMPYLSGGSLYDYIKRNGPFSESEAMKYIRQIAKALKYMHQKNICHFDVKPNNIMLDKHGNAILIDFGISKHYNTLGRQTSSTPIGLSDGYAPIEQYQKNVSIFSPASDVYALGATLYFFLHGRQPVNAPSRASGIQLMMKRSLSPEIKGIINASMKIAKIERAQDMDVFLYGSGGYSSGGYSSGGYSSGGYGSGGYSSGGYSSGGYGSGGYSSGGNSSGGYSSGGNSSGGYSSGGNGNNSDNWIGIIIGIVVIGAVIYGVFHNNGCTNRNSTRIDTIVWDPIDTDTAGADTAGADTAEIEDVEVTYPPASPPSTGTRKVVVNGVGVRLRFGPGTDNDYLPRSPMKGEELDYIGEEGDWYKVSYQGNYYYISKRYSYPAGTRKVVVDGVGVRLRFGPGLNYDYLALCPEKGAELDYIGEDDEWYHVSYQGDDYYISKQYSYLIP